MARVSVLLAVAAAVGLAGCGGGGGPKLYPVRGAVHFQDKPAAGATVVFHPLAAGNHSAPKPSGTVGPDGSFTLTTHPHGDGAPAGEYLVAIAKPDQIPVSEEADETAQALASAKAAKDRKGKPGFPPIYQVPQKSGLTATVPALDSELPPFDLSSGKK